jgi:magnesium and cobalt exporter, CNNM family
VTISSIALLCLAFIALNGIFVAAEFALLGASKTTLEHRASQGDRFAERLLRVVGSPQQQDRYIATSQLGITVASLGLGMYGEPLLAAALRPHVGAMPLISAGAIAGLLALAILTIVHILAGEMVPKSVALQHPQTVGRLAFWPMRATGAIFYPLVRLLSGISVAILAFLGVTRREGAREESYTPEELQLIVEESEQSGAIRSEAGRLLRELFEFGDLTAVQVMTPRVRIVGARMGASSAEIRQLISAARHTRYPVFESDLDHIVGMVHIKDLLRLLDADLPLDAATVRTMPVVPETSPLDDVLTTMQRSNAHLAIVIDEHGGTAGLISLEDLFEEVVGELEEGAMQASPIVPLADGSVRVPGTLRLDELGQHFDLNLEHAEVDSISGLVLALLGRPPNLGDVVDYGRVRLEVTALSGLGVGEVRASLVD